MNKSVYSYDCVIFLWKLRDGSRSPFPGEPLIRGGRPARWCHLVAGSEAAEVRGSSEGRGASMGFLVRAPLQSSPRGGGALHTKAFLQAWPFDHEPKPPPIVRVSYAQSLVAWSFRDDARGRPGGASVVLSVLDAGAVFDTSRRDAG